MTHAAIDKEWHELMNYLARVLDSAFNGGNPAAEHKEPQKAAKLPGEKTMGFCLLLFPFSGKGDGRINYISNAERADMLTAMKEFIARNEGRIIETKVQQ